MAGGETLSGVMISRCFNRHRVALLIDDDPSLQGAINSYGSAFQHGEGRPIAVGLRGAWLTGKDHHGGLELAGFEMIVAG